MRKKVILWMPALILLMSTASVNAQVIIGGSGTDEPHAGAGLDLSPLGADKLGLLLPNVELGSSATDFALVDGATDEQKTDATGMLVYNTEPCALNGPGLYLWDGDKWNIISAIEDYSTVTDIEGNNYTAARFGCAGWWMTQNLRSTKNELYELAENINSGNSNSAYYYYPYANKDIFVQHPEYGLLYTWAAASGRTSSDNEENSSHGPHQGICPSGWHLPSDLEWNQLEQVIAESAANVYSTTGAITWDVSADATGWRGTHGQKMRSTTTVNSQATDGTSKSRTENGFDALLVGTMYSGSPSSYGTYTYFWSSSSNGSSNAWYRTLYESSTGVYRYNGLKYFMFSVRCKKDE
jgi:uncharacterized protein (TIGR02145 family)